MTLDVTANAGDLWAWPPQRAGLFAKVPAPLCHIDCVIPVFHGWHGEDGTIQGLLEMANIPYASSGVLGSAIGMDKIAMKQILRGAGFPVLDFVWFTREQLKKERQAVIERVEKEIKYPAFIKPAALGSSIGVSRAKNRDELERALDVAASYDRRILVEVGVVHPVEINCAAVGYGEDVRASVCEMPVPSSNDTFLDFWQKYLRNASTKGEDSRGMKSLSRVVPAPIGEELTGRIQTMTCDIFKLLDCCGTVRVGFHPRPERYALCQRAEHDSGFAGVLICGRPAALTSPSSSRRWWKTRAPTRTKTAVCSPMIPASSRRLRRARRAAKDKNRAAVPGAQQPLFRESIAQRFVDQNNLRPLAVGRAFKRRDDVAYRLFTVRAGLQRPVSAHGLWSWNRRAR